MSQAIKQEDGELQTDTISITRTVVLPLETSTRKNEVVREAIDEFQEMASHAADLAPSFGPQGWETTNNAFYRRLTNDFEDRTISAAIAREAGQKVASSFKSWRENGQRGERPQFGDGNFLQLSTQEIAIHRNSRGWGVKLNFIPYQPEWFHINGGLYQRRYLKRITADNNSTHAGSGELRLSDDGSLSLHLSVTWDVEVYQPDEVSRIIGVDVGEKNICTTVAVEDNEIKEVDMQSGEEFRHHRERIKESRRQASKEGNLAGVKDARHSYQKYTDHITNVASRRVIDFALKHEPAVIKLRDDTGYRESEPNPIHDWPFAEIASKIAYKAQEKGIPVVKVDPAYVTQKCRMCGEVEANDRQRPHFNCSCCGYEVHADVNGAYNIATEDPNN
jgi:IS605 OrfB family transposase